MTHVADNPVFDFEAAKDLMSGRRSLRIGIFTESYPPVINGVTTSVITLIEQLERFGHQVFVFSSEFPGHKGDPENVMRIPAFFSKFDKRYPIPLPVTPRILKGVAAMKLDVIHTQSPFLMGMVAHRVARHNHVPLVATNHTLYTDYMHYVPFAPPALVKLAAHVWIGCYYSGCSAVITPSHYSAERLQQEYGVHKHRIAVIPSGIPIPKQAVSAEETALVRSTYGISADAPLLLYSGRMAQEKNLHMLLDSCEQVVFKKRPDAFLLLAGAGMEAASLQRQIDSSSVLKGRVVMTGFLPRPKLDPIYEAADLYTFPSVTETQGMVLGEAMAVGTPCVAVDAGGAPETVTPGEDGLRTPNDPIAFGEAVISLIDDPERLKAMGRAAIENAVLRTPEKMGEKVLAVYAAALTARLPMEDYDD